MTGWIAVFDSSPVRRAGIVSVLEPLALTVRSGDLEPCRQGAGPAAIVVAGAESDFAEICRILRAHGSTPSLALLELGGHAADGVQAIRDAGAEGVLPANVDGETLLAGVRLVREGFSVAPRDALPFGEGRSGAMGRPTLAPEQIKWLQRLADGATVAELAGETAYSEREMYRLLERLYVRLGARQRSRALVLAARLGFVR